MASPEKDNSIDSQQFPHFTFSDYLKVLIKYKKFLLFSTLAVGGIVAILMFFVVPPIYQSTATVKSAGSTFGMGGLLGVSGIPDLGGLEELGGSSSSKDLALYEEILTSRRCIEETIVKFNLLEEYEIKYMQDGLKLFRADILSISSNKKAGTLSLGIFDKDKQRAKDIADFMIFQLNKIFAEMSALNARNNKEFIEQRFDSVKKDLKIAEDSLREFQDIYGIAPEIQVEIAAKTSLELEATIKSEEVKLELLKKILTNNQPEIEEQEKRISLLKEQINEINNNNAEDNLLRLKGMPGTVMNFLRLKRQLEIQNKILTTLIPIYEQTKFEERRETPTVIVLDSPNLPEKKAKPKRIITTLLSMIVFFVFLSIVIICYKLYYKRVIKIIYNG